MTWSRSSRLFPGETDFLPVEAFTEIIMRSGYTGPWSLEVFNASLNVEPESGEDVVKSHGRRGIAGLESLWQACGVRDGC